MPNGLEIPFAHDRDLRSHFDVPVMWRGKQAVMHFNGYRVFDYNFIATRMLNHPHLTIYGPVHLLSHIEKRFKMRVWNTREDAADAIKHLQFDVPPIVARPNYAIYQDIYADSADDLVACQDVPLIAASKRKGRPNRTGLSRERLCSISRRSCPPDFGTGAQLLQRGPRVVGVARGLTKIRR